MALVELLDRFFAGDRRALARTITLVENGAPEAQPILASLFPRTGRAHVIGITGSPGAGKSTLTDRLSGQYRDAGRTVAIVAVDPSSPFTGGAILGDRIRMDRAVTDTGIYVRSLASRGRAGGISVATGDVVSVLDAFGFHVILVETVGAGQSEVEIMGITHTTVVVQIPGAGDDIQAIKAGILEIAHLFAVNKADRDGADRVVMDIDGVLDLAMPPRIMHARRAGKPRAGDLSLPDMPYWRAPVVKTVASDGRGIADLAARIAEHVDFLNQHNQWEPLQLQRVRIKLREMVAQSITREVLSRAEATGDLESLTAQVARRELNPHGALNLLLERHFHGAGCRMA